MSSDPFKIHEVPGGRSGRIAICRQPESDADFELVVDWQADIIVTMTIVDEFPNNSFSSDIARCAPLWMQVPVADFGVPDYDFSVILDRLGDILTKDGCVLIHCKGGQGRSGMLAMRLLVDQGEQPRSALQRIRQVRTNAVETVEQEQWASQKLISGSD